MPHTDQSTADATVASESQPTAEPATLVRNSAWNLASQATSYAVAGAVSIFAVRTFTRDEWGRYATATALLAIFLVVAESGITAFTLRRLTSEWEDAPRILGASLRALARTAIFSAALVVPLSFVLGYDGTTRKLVAIGLPMLLLQPLAGILGSAFNARQRLVNSAQVSLVTTFSFGVVAAALVASGLGPTGLLLATVASFAAAGATAVALLGRRFGVRIPSIRSWQRQPIVRAVLPLAFIGGVSIIYDRLDVIMLSKLSSASEVARYSVPYALIRLTWALPATLGAAYFPLYTRLVTEDRADAERTFLLLVRILLLASGAAALVLTFSGTPIIATAFGARYKSSGAVLAALAWGVPASFQLYLLWYVVLAGHLERRVLVILIGGLALNAGINAALIPTLGGIGAGLAYVGSESASAFGQFILIHRKMHRLPVRALASRPLVAIGVAVGIAFAVRPVSVVSSGVVAAIAFVGVLHLMRYVTITEWDPVLSPAKDLARRGGRRIGGLMSWGR